MGAPRGEGVPSGVRSALSGQGFFELGAVETDDAGFVSGAVNNNCDGDGGDFWKVGSVDFFVASTEFVEPVHEGVAKNASGGCINADFLRMIEGESHGVTRSILLRLA